MSEDGPICERCHQAFTLVRGDADEARFCDPCAQEIACALTAEEIDALLDPTTPEDMVDEELRRVGVDPVELAKRGAAIADAVRRGGP